jgi:hypothetical protein
MERLRIDLDGVPLADERGRVTAIFRYRMRDGLLLNLPESIDVLVPWASLARSDLDLRTGSVRLEFTEEGRRAHRWLSGARVLAGEWTDRGELTEVPKGSPSQR